MKVGLRTRAPAPLSTHRHISPFRLNARPTDRNLLPADRFKIDRTTPLYIELKDYIGSYESSPETTEQQGQLQPC